MVIYGFKPQERREGGQVAKMFSLDIEVLICGDMKRTDFEACLDKSCSCVYYFLVNINTLKLGL